MMWVGFYTPFAKNHFFMRRLLYWCDKSQIEQDAESRKDYNDAKQEYCKPPANADPYAMASWFKIRESHGAYGQAGGFFRFKESSLYLRRLPASSQKVFSDLFLGGILCQLIAYIDHEFIE